MLGTAIAFAWVVTIVALAVGTHRLALIVLLGLLAVLLLPFRNR